MIHPLKCFLPAFVLLLTSAADTGPLVSAAMQQTANAQNATINNALTQKENAMVLANQVKTPSPSGDVMIVDPKEVSKDWIHAFTMLKTKQTGSIIFTLLNGEKIDNIVDVQAVSGGYLLFFTLKSYQGLHYKVVKTSEISSINS